MENTSELWAQPKYSNFFVTTWRIIKTILHFQERKKRIEL
jgi:hypothetical protein